MPFRGAFKVPAQLFREFLLDFVLQRLHHARHRHQHRDFLALDGINDFAGIEAVLEDHGGADQRRDEHGQVLSKDMAERQQIEKTKRMKNPLILDVLGNFPLNRIKAGQQVPMSKHHATWLSRGAGRKNNLGSIVAAEGDRFNHICGEIGQRFAQGLQFQMRTIANWSHQ